MDKTVKTSTDTCALKIIAFLSMLIDHIGYCFFPEYTFLRIIGRIAFPLFAYTLVLGFIHTHNLKKYFLRLLGFSLISQIPYTLCFFGGNFREIHLNIGFTMMLGLYSCLGIKDKKYYRTAIALGLSLLPAVEYGFYGVFLITVMYAFIFESKGAFALAVGICLSINIVTYFMEGWFDLQVWAILALPFMLLQSDLGVKLPRWLNYGFYPAHLLLLWVIGEFLI